MFPGRRAREEGSPTPQARQRARPSLSADGLMRHFLVEDQVSIGTGMPERYLWEPRHVRFVIWYRLTTRLPPVAIAVAFNSTFGADHGHVPAMKGRNVDFIFETISARMLRIEDEMAQRGNRWLKPTELGWAPCDHEMCCGTLALSSPGRDRRSVMRPARNRTRGTGFMEQMATTLWPGSWEDILECPRDHEETDPAGSPSSASPSAE